MHLRTPSAAASKILAYMITIDNVTTVRPCQNYTNNATLTPPVNLLPAVNTSEEEVGVGGHLPAQPFFLPPPHKLLRCPFKK